MIPTDPLPFCSVPLGYITAPLTGLNGTIKSRPEDFVVEELPAYEPSGAGEHLFLWIEKRDVSAEQLLQHLSHCLRISRGDIGTAGLKDRRAVTRQYVSVPRSCEPRVPQLDTEAIRVLAAKPHGNKLRTGHLQGNRFEILIRDVHPSAADRLWPLIETLNARGFPNAYGEQRFGHAGHTLKLGLGLLTGEESERAIPWRRRKFLLRLALSAVQSALFNAVLAERLDESLLQTVLPGDVMQVVASGGPFVVEDVDREQQRFDAREIVLTGPMFGPRMRSPSGRAAEREDRVLKRAGLTTGHFARQGKLLPGTRRPLLVWPLDLTGRVEPEGVRICVTLPPGAYVTSLLREICKSTVSDEEDVTDAP